MTLSQGEPILWILNGKGCQIIKDSSREELVGLVRSRKEGDITSSGAVLVKTGEFTGRTPGDKYIVKTKETDTRVWWGPINQAISEDQFNGILKSQLDYLQRKAIFVQKLSAGGEGYDSLPLQIITETAWQSLFCLNLFKPCPENQFKRVLSPLTIIHTPNFRLSPSSAGTHSGVFIILHLERMLVLIGGTSYAGEIKKAVFSVMNYLFPLQGTLTMHCSANLGRDGGTALFFGLSGTGKTTLSSSPDRELIGDDEHGWNDVGLFNLEGGCYAKTIRLDERKEPIIWRASQAAGSVLENVVYDPGAGLIDFSSAEITENTRAAYPLSSVTRLESGRIQAPPRTIFLLTADAFGVLPPIAKLDHEQAVYYFLSGYTSKIAATEQGLESEPCATFSTCFAEPFLPLPPSIYTDLFKDRIHQFQPEIWLVNTGWIGGPFGIGHRIELATTRAIIAEAIRGEIPLGRSWTDPVFGFQIPDLVPGVAPEVLNPRAMWADKKKYDHYAFELREKFEHNFYRVKM